MKFSCFDFILQSNTLSPKVGIHIRLFQNGEFQLACSMKQ
jgi:hypothetical protein